MNPNSYQPAPFKLLILTGAALLLTGLLLAPLLAASPAAGQPLSPAFSRQTGPVGNPSAAPELGSLVKIESGNPLVTNGERVTYTLILTNPGPAEITNIQLLNQLPEDSLDGLQITGGCDSPACGLVFETKYIPNLRGGGTIPIQIPQAITWSIPSLPPGSRYTRSFSGRVKCQGEGETFTNQTFLFSDDGNASDTLTLTATVRPLSGGAGISQAPTWCSNDVGGSFDLDWGDFDRDGDLDLALGSTLGTIVYRNQTGHLELFWEKEAYTLGVRWADFDGNGSLELVAVGRSDGSNPIYRYNPAAGGTPGNANNFLVFDTFKAPFQLLRVAPGDYDNQNGPDLAVSSAALNAAPCPVLLYRNNGSGQFGDSGECLSDEAAAALAPADYDNDGDLDLALGFFRSKQIRLLTNNGLVTPTLVLSESILIDHSLPFLAYDLAWGDYDRDGRLDLAAAFPLQREGRVYRNTGSGFSLAAAPIRTQAFLTPRAVDWSDFEGDGRLNLALADSPPRIYRYDVPANRFQPALALPAGPAGSQIWRLQGVDLDGDTDPDLAMSQQKGPARLFTAFTPRLNPTLSPILAQPASSVAWGDKDGDRALDLLFGAGPQFSAPDLKLYRNSQGSFSGPPLAIEVAVGPNSLAFGDVDGNGSLEIAATIAGYGVGLYRAGDGALLWQDTGLDPAGLAWGDATEDNDSRLDLLVAVRNGPNILYLNRSSGGSIQLVPGWSTPEADNSYSLAWGDYDNDTDLDFAVGNGGQPNRIYRNEGGHRFSLAWSSPLSNQTRSLAWADYDGDGDLDLAAANDGQPNYLYENRGLTFSPVWRSADSRNSLSLAWGDWDNDGDPDLAVGNNGQPDQVYLNQGSRPGRAHLALLWQSAEAQATSQVAWGDKDGDGDLDLAVSQHGDGWNGLYENHAVAPAHLAGGSSLPLPNNPTYLAVDRPGQTAAAYFFSTGELLAGPPVPNPVRIDYTLFDPDGQGLTRAIDPATVGTPLSGLRFEYSLNGGGRWHKATPYAPPEVPVPSRGGVTTIFRWDALTDLTLGNNVCFRICAFYQNPVGPSRRASACGASPPFRVRALTCKWPDNPSITVLTPHPQPGLPVHLRGDVSGSGSFYYTWELDGRSIENSQLIRHTFPQPGAYGITLTVTGEPCPVTRETVATKTLVLGGVVTGQQKVYLPVVLGAESLPPAASGPVFSAFADPPGRPAPVTGLRGQARPEQGATHLSWNLNPPADQVTGYRIYRSPRRPTAPFRRLADLPAGTTTYRDGTGPCGYVYFVTAVNAVGESRPSRASYQAPGCE